MNTGFVDIPSVRGYTCFQLFTGVESQTMQVHPLRSEHMNHTSLQHLCQELGSPAAIKSDNAKLETSTKWNAICRQQCIAQLASEAENQQQNKAECRIEDVCRLGAVALHKTGGDKRLWCYPLEHICEHYDKCRLFYPFCGLAKIA